MLRQLTTSKQWGTQMHQGSMANAACAAHVQRTSIRLYACLQARDGVCDEGRRGNITAAGRVSWVSCDVGTDCHDCGPWQGLQHGPAW
jgi:hypothetical protein